MPLAISCPTCHATLTVQDELAGRKIRCTGCSTVLLVPAAHPAGSAVRSRSQQGDGDEKRVKKKKKKSVKTAAPSKGVLYAVIGGGVALFIAVVVLVIMFVPFGSMFSEKELEVVDAYTAINGMGYHTTGERMMQSKLTALAIPGRRKIIVTRANPDGGYLKINLKIPYTDVEAYFPGSYAASRPFLTHGPIKLECAGQTCPPWYYCPETDASNGFQLDWAPRSDKTPPLETFLGPSKEFNWTCDGEMQEGEDGRIYRGKHGLIAKIRIGGERQDGHEGENPLNRLTGRKIFQDRDGLVSGPGGYIHVSWNQNSGGWIVADEIEMPNEIGRYWTVTCFFERPKARNTEATLHILKKQKKIKLP
jgi:predicted Zn finger-like uncharacterized protein